MAALESSYGRELLCSIACALSQCMLLKEAAAHAGAAVLTAEIE
jgi:hypothetical protein